MSAVETLTSSGLVEATQADISNANGYAVKARLNGSIISNLSDFDTFRVFYIDTSGSTFQCRLAANGSGGVRLDIQDNGGAGALFNGSFHARTNYSADTEYTFYWAHFSSGESPNAVLAAYEADGTEIQRDTQSFSGGSIQAGDGSVHYGGSSLSLVEMDAVAVYDGHAPDETSEPDPSDANILAYWAMKEGSGTTVANEVSGGSDMSITGTEDTDWQWTAFGSWDASTGGAVFSDAVFSDSVDFTVDIGLQDGDVTFSDSATLQTIGADVVLSRDGSEDVVFTDSATRTFVEDLDLDGSAGVSALFQDSASFNIPGPGDDNGVGRFIEFFRTYVLGRGSLTDSDMIDGDGFVN